MVTMEQVKARLAEKDGLAAVATNEGWKAFTDIRVSGTGFVIKRGKRWDFIFGLDHVRIGLWKRGE
jgi:hypothetical protein